MVKFKKKSILIWFFLLSISCSLAQEKQQSIISDELGLSTQDKRIQSITQPSGVPLESTINPDKYYVGPSDIIAVNIWTSPPMNFTLTVTPEGTLIVPTIGEVKISALTLAQAKLKIINEARKKYLNAEITVTLIKPRPIIVSIVGNVLNAGLYTLSSIDRTTKAIEEANKPTRLQTQNDVNDILYWMSTRNIVLKHNDGTQDRVDVVKFLATKDDKWNPYLREGDVVIVPRKNPVKNVIGIYGEVNSPGRYEFVDGDGLRDLIEIGMGFTPLARKDSIELIRLSLDGTQLHTQYVDVDRILDGSIPDIKIEPGDRVVVKAKKELREDYRVHIMGEVLNPGTYPITKNTTKLSEAIKRAGGFTEFAALKSTTLNRRSIQANEIEIERLLSARGGVSQEDSLNYFLETELRLRREIVNVDFDKLFNALDTSQDVLLQDEDYIIVPSIKKTIYVFGQVVTPGHVPFVQGMSSEYYIQKSGGFTDRARTGDVKIIKNKTRQWLDPEETIIEDGDYIWVPRKPDRPFAYYMNIASQAASVMSVIIGIAVIIIQATK